ncbi:MAG TPA: hypothetical protein VIT43_07680 [Candidatus Dormibacteraeota bacterium]
MPDQVFDSEHELVGVTEENRKNWLWIAQGAIVQHRQIALQERHSAAEAIFRLQT